MTQQDAVSQTLKTIYNALEEALDHRLFETPNADMTESAIQNTALCFDAPNFIALTVSGQKYVRESKSDFIEDMRMHFADNPNFVIDGVFEYRLEQPLPTIQFSYTPGKRFFEIAGL